MIPKERAREREKFFTPIGRNPLKRLDPKK
jgi:hypothetical protein